MSFSRPACPFDLGAVDFEARPLIDWLAAERQAKLDLNLSQCPLILIGANAVLAQPFVAACKAGLNVVAIIDNALPADTASTPMIVGDADLDLVLKTFPDAVGILCCGSENALRHFRHLWGPRPQALLFYFEVIAALDMAPGFRLDFMRRFQSLETAQAARRTASRHLTDAASLKTLDALLLHHLTWDIGLLDAVSRPEKAIYFENDVMPLTAEEVFVDGGAYDGDTVRQFLAASGGRYRHVHAFELDPVNAAALVDKTRDVARLTPHAVGLWSRRAQLALEHRDDDGSRVSAHGDHYSDLVALDDLDIAPPTFIKLDVEGAEVEALRGAARLIAEHKPKLAICAYHKADDLATLFDTVMSLRDDYQFHLRHYSPIVFDTVIYAT